MLVQFGFLLQNNGTNTLLSQSDGESQTNRPCPHDYHWEIWCWPTGILTHLQTLQQPQGEG